MIRKPRRRLTGRLVPRLRPFYRRFPFTSPVSIRSADARGCVDFDLGVFYNRVPKAANSTVIVNLATEKFGSEVPSKAAKRLFRRPAELTRSELERFDRLFRFTFVRNPYTRVLSAYLDKVERKARMRNECSTFEGFVAYLERGGLYRNMHWAPQHALLLLPIDGFDFIGRVEQMELDLARVFRYLRGQDDRVPVRAERGNSTHASGKVAQYYTPETCDRIRQLYARDFELFDYDTEPPGRGASEADVGDKVRRDI